MQRDLLVDERFERVLLRELAEVELHQTEVRCDGGR